VGGCTAECPLESSLEENLSRTHECHAVIEAIVSPCDIVAVAPRIQQHHHHSFQQQNCHLKQVHCTESHVCHPLKSTDTAARNRQPNSIIKARCCGASDCVTCKTLNVALAIFPSSTSLPDPLPLVLSSLPWLSPLSFENFFTSMSSTTCVNR
jgi:hypothetical protein